MSNDIDTRRKKRAKVTSFTSNKKNMIMNAYLHVKETWPLDQYPYKTDLKKKTAEVLGISIVTLSAVLKEFKSMDEIKPQLLTRDTPKFRQKVDNFDKCSIRKKIHSFYINGELPTVAKVFQAVNNDAGIPNFSRSTLRRVIRHLQFKFIKRHMTKALIDTENTVLCRRAYLKKIKDYRQRNHQIFYIGVACINPGQTSADKEKLRQLVIMHVGNEKGFLEGGEKVFECRSFRFYHTLATSHFEQWFEDVLPKLGENAVVVMDKAPHCSRLLESIATADWSKQDIQNWLKTKDIPFNQNEAKIELLEKVKKVKHIIKKYAVDELAKKFDVEILWLPPHHYDLSPIEYILADIQGGVDFEKSNLKIEDIAELLQKGIKQITVEKWSQYVQHVVGEEENYYSKIDEIIDRTVDSFFTGVADSETDSMNSSDDDD